MILLDTSALLAFLYGEPAEAQVAALLRGETCATPSSCLAEVVDQLIRHSGVSPESVAERLSPLIEVSLGVLPIENRAAWQAGEFRAAHYARSGADISLADSLLLAVTGPDDKIATSDAALIAVADELQLGVIPLPSSRGHRP